MTIDQALIRDLRAERSSQRTYADQADRLTREAFAARTIGRIRDAAKALGAAELAARAARAERANPEPAA